MTNDPEIRARILEWQKRFQIRDDDPAMALIELLDIYGGPHPTSSDPAAILPSPEELKILASNSERTNFLLQELKESLGKMQLVELSEQFRGYHEGIDLATKKMAVIIKEGDDLLTRLGKVAAQINPVARGAIAVLMIVSGVIGWLIAKLF